MHEGISYWQDDFSPMLKLGPTLEAFDHLRGIEPFDFVFID